MAEVVDPHQEVDAADAEGVDVPKLGGDELVPPQTGSDQRLDREPALLWDAREEMREFLTSRRARITPDQAGLPTYSARNRRVRGLRREEVAMLAGISVEYYTRLERGNANGASEVVVDGVSRALQLDAAELAHLANLVRTTNTHRAPRSRVVQRVRPVVQQVLDSMTNAPAFVMNPRLDVLASNELGRALYAPMFADDPRNPVNLARFTFLDPASHDYWGDWERAARDTVAILRAAAGRDPYDRHLSDLVGELSTGSAEFRVGWAAHDVKFHVSGVNVIHHPLVGDVTLAFESLHVSADVGQTLVVYSAEPGSASREALNLLAAWTAVASLEAGKGSLLGSRGR